MASAKRRKSAIYAEILDYGLSCDAFHMTNPHEAGVVRCMQNALTRAGLKPEEIDEIFDFKYHLKNVDKIFRHVGI